MCARFWGEGCTGDPATAENRPVKIFIFFPGFSCDSSEHVLRPRLRPTTPQTRKVVFWIGPDDCEALTTAFFWNSCTYLRCHQLDLRLYSNSEHSGVQSLDFKKSSPRTSIRQPQKQLRFCVWSFREKVGFDALCQRLQTLAAQTVCTAHNRLFHAMRTTCWHRIQTSSAASLFSSGLTGSSRAQTIDGYVSFWRALETSSHLVSNSRMLSS